MVKESIIQQTKRVCYACGSDTTYKTHWYSNRPLNQWLCEKCNNNIIKNPKWHQINSKRRLNFRGKQFYLDAIPRIGVCNYCRAVVPFDCKRTNMHHEEYHSENIDKDTIEICIICHNSLRRKTTR